MTFEYDINKSKANKIKHGIDFEEAKELWSGEHISIVPVRSHTESRLAAIGKIYNKIWTVVFTLRNEKIRIISARRAREKEIAHYEQTKNN